MTTDIARTQRFDDNALRSLRTWDDVSALISEHGLTAVAADEVLGNGFALLTADEKATLVGVPMILLDWRFNSGDMGTFVSIMAAVKAGDTMRKVIINDGSTGICAQLETLEFRGIVGPLLVKNGLVRSDYDYEDTDKNGKKVMRPATTYYLSESA